jgi:hypothetical protein
MMQFLAAVWYASAVFLLILLSFSGGQQSEYSKEQQQNLKDNGSVVQLDVFS